MKRILLLLLVFAAFLAQAKTLAVFDQTNYSGWNYTRTSVALNTDNISKNNIKLFKGTDGKDYTLISPAIDCTGYKALKITLNWYATTYDNENYDLNIANPTVEMITDSVVNFNVITLTKAMLGHTDVVSLEIPNGLKSVCIRIAAWHANLDNVVAVRSVVIEDTDSGVDGIDCAGTTVKATSGAVLINADMAQPIAVYNLKGQCMYHGNIATGESRINLNQGVYIVKTANKTSTVSVK
jgi:hypothetical protein